jgi:putative transposase
MTSTLETALRTAVKEEALMLHYQPVVRIDIPSFSRPHVSDDNPYSEALFRTLKHTPAYLRLPFADVASATRWVARFAEWYNGTHRHSAIRYVTPDQRHHGRERAVLASRHELYERVRRAYPSAGAARRAIGCPSDSSCSTPSAHRIRLWHIRPRHD